MKIAILSDIHANLQALEAVLEDCVKQGVGEYWLLGDYIDYGADAVPVLRLLSCLEDKIKYAIGGNHDAGLFGYTDRIIEDYAAYTRKIYKKNYKDFAWLKKTAKVETEYALDGKAILVHAGIRNPYWGDSSNYEPFDDLEHLGFDYLFCGHSHYQFVLIQDKGRFAHNEPIIISNQRAIINPGSVGQPRNRSTKANYAILEDDVITFRRVTYDIYGAIEAIKKAGYDDWQGQRLTMGR